MRVLLLYYTRTGHTLEAVEATAEGIRSCGSEATVAAIGGYDPSGVAGYDALIVGSPCWTGSVTPSGVAWPVLHALKLWPSGLLAGKRCGAVSVHSGTGGETTVATLGRLLGQKGCTDYRPGPAARAGVPLSLWKGPAVREVDRRRFRAYGAQFAACGVCGDPPSSPGSAR